MSCSDGRRPLGCGEYEWPRMSVLACSLIDVTMIQANDKLLALRAVAVRAAERGFPIPVKQMGQAHTMHMCMGVCMHACNRRGQVDGDVLKRAHEEGRIDECVPYLSHDSMPHLHPFERTCMHRWRQHVSNCRARVNVACLSCVFVSQLQLSCGMNELRWLC